MANMHTDIQFYIECFVLGYFNNLILLPYLFDRKKYLSYFLTIFSVVFAYNFLSTEITLWLSPRITNADLMTLYSLIDLFIFILAFSAARLIRKQIEQNYEFSKIKEEKLQNEVDFLKSQINPHLLFNTLNTIYSASLEESEKVPAMILKLSDLMRFMLYETNEKDVPLEKEIEYIKNYISLQELRLESRGKITFQLIGEFGPLTIAPVLLISFVENAFKHSANSLTDDIDILISIRIEAYQLTFIAANNYDPEYVMTDEIGGLGLSNSRKRLQLLYPEKHTLSISDQNGQFEVALKIDLRK